MTRRMERINVLLRHEISELIAKAVKDPRLAHLVSVTAVETSTDLRHSRVYISVMGDQKEKEEALQGLDSASRFLHRELRMRLNLRHTPELQFLLDDSIERGTHLLELMDQMEEERSSQSSSPRLSYKRP